MNQGTAAMVYKQSQFFISMFQSYSYSSLVYLCIIFDDSEKIICRKVHFKKDKYYVPTK